MPLVGMTSPLHSELPRGRDSPHFSLSPGHTVGPLSRGEEGLAAKWPSKEMTSDHWDEKSASEQSSGTRVAGTVALALTPLVYTRSPCSAGGLLLWETRAWGSSAGASPPPPAPSLEGASVVSGRGDRRAVRGPELWFPRSEVARALRSGVPGTRPAAGTTSLPVLCSEPTQGGARVGDTRALQAPFGFWGPMQLALSPPFLWVTLTALGTDTVQV